MSNRLHTASRTPSSVDQTLEQALLAMRMQCFTAAERLAAGVLKSEPGNVHAAQVLGHALLMQSRPAEAIDPLHRAVRQSDDPATETLLARALAAAGRAEEALDQLRRTTARRPPFPLAFLEMGDQLAKAGRFDEGVAVFESGLSLAPDAAVLRMGLGYLHLERNDRSGARALFSAVRAAAPERHDALVALARVLVLDGEYVAAAALYRRALTLRPGDALTRIDLGKCLLEMGERAAGEAALRAATSGAVQLAGLAMTALAAAPRGRFFLRPSAAARFLRLEPISAL